MVDKLIYIDKGEILTLKYLESVHPSEVHPKADHWKEIFRLLKDNKLSDPGLFTDNYFVSDDKRLLIIEEYNLSMNQLRNIKFDEDVIHNLRLFDLEKRKTGKFSQITGGRFQIMSCNGDKIVFHKIYDDKTIEYETQLKDIVLNDISV